MRESDTTTKCVSKCLGNEISVHTREENAVSPPPLSGFSSTQKNVVEGGFISHVWLE